MDSLGQRIKHLRLQANLNKAALARKVGVSDVTISYWESGAIKQIGHERLVALADALGCTLGQLLEGDTQTTSAPLYLRGNSPAPWQTPNSNRLSLSGEILAGLDWQGECYLVTPAPGEEFAFLESGDLAAFGPTETCDQPGHYLIEGSGGLYIGQLRHGSRGELLYCNGSDSEASLVPLEATEKVVGRLLARWRKDGV
ncbi:helix-turn-helix domain-containing protein [Billgrantia tianxiuensis]|jgi:transcriptional regulator with XRE-family HTH domain|uniref:Helix-turn-helix domain-containing protein n=1 Tax=Billgrantia tianxiuensis TaxID=2497861 RepID=A0A6I6SNV8_9GAMM|nr:MULTISPECIES: helix-turn-helix domain-containing protein [Halomonas]MCE8032554.1 helix-turn-helix domain-containing protein [Halomonas sp. MCCC 1A11057]QHC49510.1 helix-turn-helix domain-containing protein [Halomonas tianxiuensis]